MLMRHYRFKFYTRRWASVNIFSTLPSHCSNCERGKCRWNCRFCSYYSSYCCKILVTWPQTLSCKSGTMTC